MSSVITPPSLAVILTRKAHGWLMSNAGPIVTAEPVVALRTAPDPTSSRSSQV